MYGSWTKVAVLLRIFFGIHLRPFRRFYGAYLFSRSANTTFKILIDGPFWRGWFWELFYTEKCNENSAAFFETTYQFTVEFCCVFCRRYLLILKKPPKWMILNVDFALKLRNYTTFYRFICLKYILKYFPTILHSHFNYHTLPVTPFNFSIKVFPQKQIIFATHGGRPLIYKAINYVR